MSSNISGQKFQAVVLAGGQGNRMSALTSNYPKALLQVGNRPLLSYQLDMLFSAGVDDIVVLTKASMKEEIERFVDKTYHYRNIRTVAAPAAALGSADSLRECRKELDITRNFFVLATDVITNVPLQTLAAMHINRGSVLTMLLHVPPAAAAAAAGGPSAAAAAAAQDDADVDDQFIALDETTGQLAYVRSRSDLPSGLALPKRLLSSFPALGVYTQLRDAHLHVFSPAIFDFLDEHPYISSLQGELVPALVASQFTAPPPVSAAAAAAAAAVAAANAGSEPTSLSGSVTLPSIGSGSIPSSLSGIAATGGVNGAAAASVCLTTTLSASLPRSGAAAAAASRVSGADDSLDGDDGNEDDEDLLNAAEDAAEAADVAALTRSHAHLTPTVAPAAGAGAGAGVAPVAAGTAAAPAAGGRCFAYVAPGSALLERCNTVASLRLLSSTLLSRARAADAAALTGSVPAPAAAGLPACAGSAATDPWPAVTVGDGTAAARAQAPTAAIDAGSLLGEGVELRPSTTHESFVGAHCRIGLGARLNNSVVMDHVTVGAKAVLTNCVVAPQAQIADGAVLTRCTVAFGVEVGPGTYTDAELRPPTEDEDEDE